MEHYIDMWRRILQFEGRTSRPGYWWPFLINGIVGALVSLIFSELIVSIYNIALIVATFTLTCRRLRDANFQWWWALFRFAGVITLPFSGILSLIPVVMCAFPTRGPQYIDAA